MSVYKEIVKILFFLKKIEKSQPEKVEEFKNRLDYWGRILLENKTSLSLKELSSLIIEDIYRKRNGLKKISIVVSLPNGFIKIFVFGNDDTLKKIWEFEN